MGLGTLFLYADAYADPRELLNEFALDEGFPLEVLHSKQLPGGLLPFRMPDGLLHYGILRQLRRSHVRRLRGQPIHGNWP